MHILEEKIRAARAAGRHALIPFVTFGFPDEKRFWPALVELDESGADIIEIGVPFSDPVADGPVVEEASRRVLSDGVCLERIMEELKLRAGVFRAGIVLMGYLNPFLHYGLIIPDLPFEESGDIRRIFAAQGLALIALVGPNTPEERMRLYADVSEGYVYVVSAMATTGQRARMEMQVAETLQRARSVFRLPLALGFGLEQPEQMQGLPPDTLPDAVVFGSALLKYLDAGKPAAEFIARWK